MSNQELFWVFLKKGYQHVCLRRKLEELDGIIQNLGESKNIEYKKIKRADVKKMDVKIDSTYIGFDNCKDPQNIIELKIK